MRAVCQGRAGERGEMIEGREERGVSSVDDEADVERGGGGGGWVDDVIDEKEDDGEALEGTDKTD